MALLALKGAEVKLLSVKGAGAKECALKWRAFQSAPAADCINLLCHVSASEISLALIFHIVGLSIRERTKTRRRGWKNVSGPMDAGQKMRYTVGVPRENKDREELS